jgi:hypothetical protein
VPYSVLADVTVLCHFIWILFLVCGIIFALIGSKIAWLHLGGLLFSLILNLLGSYCPLTYLEHYLRGLESGMGSYTGSFIARYVELIVYPDVSERAIRIGEVVFVGMNLCVYGLLARRYRASPHS